MILINIIFLVSNRCYTSYTPFVVTKSSRSSLDLDNHHVACGVNEMIQSIKFSRDNSGTKIRYNFTCCKTSYPCDQRTEVNPYTDNGSGSAFFLDRQIVQCSHDDFITSFRLTSNITLGKIRYIYKCCNTPGRNKTSYLAETPLNDDGDGHVWYLDRHLISCQYGYGLSKFHLLRNIEKYQYKFTCTKILTSCVKPGKKQQQSGYSENFSLKMRFCINYFQGGL